MIQNKYKDQIAISPYSRQSMIISPKKRVDNFSTGQFQPLPVTNMEISIGKTHGAGEVDDLIRWANELPDDV